MVRRSPAEGHETVDVKIVNGYRQRLLVDVAEQRKASFSEVANGSGMRSTSHSLHSGFHSLTPKLGGEVKGIDIVAFMNAFS